MANASVVVVGSVNLDLVAQVPRFPRPGETLTDAVLTSFPGGKGANQATAARRLGADVQLLACVGDDGSADQALAGMRSAGVNLDRVRRLSGVATGTALILVNAEGENQIVVAPGANRAFTPDLLTLPEADAVIAQLELPVETVLKAARQCRGLFCLNAAPVRPIPAALLDHVDLLVVNEVEAEALADVLAGYQGLIAMTLGGRGARIMKGAEVLASATPPNVDVVDTTGAGDAFTAALTVALAEGLQKPQALSMACAAGAITATRPGAQSSPTREEVDAVLAESGSL